MNEKTISINVSEMIATIDDIVVGGTFDLGLSVCLFADDGKAGGILHYFPSTVAKDAAESPLFSGDLSVESLIKKLTTLTGYSTSRFCAKLVGGAFYSDDKGLSETQSRLNIKVAKKILSQNHIKVVGEDTGGFLKRKIRFHLKSGRLQSAFLEALKQPPALQPTQPSTNENVADKFIQKKKVLIVDDSKTIRDLLKMIIQQDTRLEVVGEAEDPIQAELLLARLKPDVISLDVHMPRMTGVQWLKTLLPKYPIAVVMITSLDLKDGNEVFQALELGAIDYIQKPTLAGVNIFSSVIREKLFAASHAKIRIGRPLKLPVAISRLESSFDPDIILAIGASTGGTEALKEVFLRLPKEIPRTLVVQHIPPIFSRAFADRLNDLCPFDVKEAEDGDAVHENRVLIAPGGCQMKMVKKSSGYFVQVNDDDPVNRHKPSVDYLFDSIAELKLKKTIGVILTGMGADGAKGLLNMKNNGALTLSQDEASSIVYGMPKVAWELGGSQHQVELEKIADKIVSFGKRKI